MRRIAATAALALLSSTVAHAQVGPAARPVAAPPAPKDDAPEEIAKDAARDLTDDRFYNKPGATRADYEADWQDCRLIARGSRTPSGQVPYFYNPAVISPVAAAAGAGFAGLIAGKIKEGEQRRANRRTCLMVRGWRLVEPSDAEGARIAAMTPEQRSAHFDAVVGAPTVTGVVTERTRFDLAPDPLIKLDGPVALPGTIQLGKKVDTAKPLALGPNEGALVLAFRRPDAGSLGRSASVALSRYDLEGRDLVYRPRDWKKRGDATTYLAAASSVDKKAAYEVHVIKLTAGDYVFTSRSTGGGVGAGSAMGMLVGAGGAPAVATNCFGAPTVHIGAGEVVYAGDFVPLVNAPASGGTKVTGIAHTRNLEDARTTLAARQPALAAALQPATMRNGATYACVGTAMDRWDVADAPMLPPLVDQAPAPMATTS